MPKQNDLTKIPTDEVLKDLKETAEDLCVCHQALNLGITHYSGYSESVLERYKENLQQIEVMVEILKSRH